MLLKIKYLKNMKVICAGWGRTGMGIMIKRESSAWSVPKAYAGTFNNNFATRALEGMQDEIDILIRREITKAIK